MAAIEISGLTKRFGATCALDDFSLDVIDGEVHGFLGPNGAGKTTTLRILLGLAKADAGDLRVLGRDPWSSAVDLHHDMAYVPGDVSLWPTLTGGETIDLLLRLRDADPVRRDELVDRFELDPSKRVRAYSKGNRQKVALIAALAANAELYLFDEPTDGLDPLMAQVYRDCVQDVRERGATVFVSSHILGEVEAITDRITIIRKGRNIETGTIADMRHLTRTHVTAETKQPATSLSESDHISALVAEGTRLSCDADAEGLDEVLAALHEVGVVSLDCRPPSLEDLFLTYYREPPSTTPEPSDPKPTMESDS